MALHNMHSEVANYQGMVMYKANGLEVHVGVWFLIHFGWPYCKLELMLSTKSLHIIVVSGYTNVA